LVDWILGSLVKALFDTFEHFAYLSL
jgi:hypothetical protein